jgi:homoserine dehydrogenase
MGYDVRVINIALVGFGNVGQALSRLLEGKATVLREEYNTEFRLVGIATATRGIAVDPSGMSAEVAIAAARERRLQDLHTIQPMYDIPSFIRDVPAEIIVETTPLNTTDGQPALDYLKTALYTGKHVVTANKGPLAHGYHTLRQIAQENQRGFFFEACVMGGAPTIDLARECLLAAHFQRIYGILNSTTNSILDRMREGTAIDIAVKEMQDRGLAETDPSHDVDGWDSAVKLVILANVLMGADLRPGDVARVGIRGVSHADLQDAAAADKTIRLLCEARRHPETGDVVASVQPTALPDSDPLAHNSGPTNTIVFQTDEMTLQVTEHYGTPTSTAYAMLRDLINIARDRIS